MSHNDSSPGGPHVNVPYDLLDKYLPFIKENRLNLEIYFGSRSFDKLTEREMIKLKDKLDYSPQLTIHAPFMDLSPGAVDPKVREITFKRFSGVLDFADILMPRVRLKTYLKMNRKTSCFWRKKWIQKISVCVLIPDILIFFQNLLFLNGLK
jgi:hypothetical protein